MEYVIVTYPTRRMVYIDGEQNGYTQDVLRVDAGTHKFELGNVFNFTPSFRRVTVEDTSLFEPLEIAFSPKENEA